MAREYIAFISYRHMPLDKEIADKVHKMIERYVIPKELRRNGQKHMGIAFRDQEELPLSSNLTGDIYTALDNSQFLIVICTPDTPKSLWVTKEIEYFIQKHGRERILTVLASGSMEESVPKAITTIYGEDGKTVIGQQEPLAAMIVAPTKSKTRTLLRREFLRLAAAMLGCPYDALIQRSKRYRMQLLSAVLGIVAMVSFAFLGLLLKKNAEVNAQLYQALINESKALAYQSQSVLEHSSRHEAIALALSALPSEDNDRPYVAEAEAALASALQVYDHLNLRLDTEIVQNDLIYSLSDQLITQDGRYVFLTEGYDTLCCYDAHTGQLKWKQTGPLFNNIWDITSTYDETAILMRTRVSVVVMDLETGEVLRQSTLSDSPDSEVGPGDLLIAEQVWMQGGIYNLNTNKLEPRLFNQLQAENFLSCHKDSILFLNEDLCFMKFTDDEMWHYLYVFDQHTGEKVGELDFHKILEEDLDYVYYNARPDGTFHLYGFFYTNQEHPFIRLAVTDAAGNILKEKEIIPELPYTEIFDCEYVGEKALFSTQGSMFLIDMDSLTLEQIAMPEGYYFSGMDSNGNILAYLGEDSVLYIPSGDHGKEISEYEIPMNYEIQDEDQLNVIGTAMYLEPTGSNITYRILRPVGGTDHSELSLHGIDWDWQTEAEQVLLKEAEEAFAASIDVAPDDIYAGKTHAVLFHEGAILVYDAQSNILSDWLPVEFTKIEEGTAKLIRNDTALAVLENSGSCIIVDLETGETLARYAIKYGEFRVYFHTDQEERFLYVCNTTGGGSGYRIDMESWEIVAEITGLRNYNAEDDLMFCSISPEDDLGVSGNYYLPLTTEELIAMGNAVLNGEPE